MSYLLLIVPVSIVFAAVSPFQPVMDSAGALLEAENYRELLLKLKGYNADGSRMDENAYLSYMSTLLTDPRARPADWKPDQLSVFLDALAKSESIKPDKSQVIGIATVQEWREIVRALFGAKAVRDEMPYLRGTSLLASSRASALAEGGHYSRLAYYASRGSIVFGSDSDLSARLIRYIKGVSQSPNLEKDIADARGSTLLATRTLQFVDYGGDTRDRRAPSELAILLSSIWNARFLPIPLFDEFPVKLLVSVFDKMEIAMTTLKRSPVSEELLSQLSEVVTLVGEMLPVIRSIADKRITINEHSQGGYVGVYLGEGSEEDRLSQGFDLLKIEDISESAKVAAEEPIAEDSMLADSMRAKAGFAQPVVASPVAPVLPFLAVRDDDPRQSEELNKEYKLAVQGKSNSLARLLDTCRSNALFQVTVVEEFRDVLFWKALAEVGKTVPFIAAKIRVAVGAGLNQAAIKYIQTLPGYLGNDGWKSVAKLIQYLPITSAQAETGQIEGLSPLLGDTAEWGAFLAFSGALAKLRSEHPSEKLEDFVFPGFADFALFVFAGETDMALKRISRMSYLDHSEFDWSKVATLIVAYTVFGKYTEFVTSRFPILIDEVGALEKGLKMGFVNVAVARILQVFEEPQLPRIRTTDVPYKHVKSEMLDVMSPEKCREITMMARYVILRIVKTYGIDKHEVRAKILAQDVRYEENGRLFTEAELVTPIEDVAKAPSFWYFLLTNPRYVTAFGDYITDLVPSNGYLARVCVKWIAYQNNFGFELNMGRRGKVYPNLHQVLGYVKYYIGRFIPLNTKEVPKLEVLVPLKPLAPVTVNRAAVSPESVMSPPQSPKTPKEDVQDALEALLVQVGQMELGEVD